MHPKTVKVATDAADNPDKFYFLNESDFNPEKHKLWQPAPPPTPPAPEVPKQSEAPKAPVEPPKQAAAPQPKK